MPRHLLSSALLMIVGLAACNDTAVQSEQTRGSSPFLPAAAETKDGPELGTFGIDLTAQDNGVQPGDDFFRYANGAWLDAFEIPPAFSNYGSFTRLFERSEAQVRQLIDDAATGDAPRGSAAQKIGDFYNSYLDTEKIEQRGLAPIEAQLKAYEGLQDHGDVARAFADRRNLSRRPFTIRVDVDVRAPSAYALYIGQGGLGMPNRRYYTQPEFAPQRDAYRTFLAAMLDIAGADETGRRAAAVFDLERRLAEAHWSPEKRRNRDLTYNPYTQSELKAYTPELPWEVMLDGLGLESQQRFILRENDALAKTGEIFADTPVEVWRDYLKAHALSRYADVLPGEVNDAHFAFHGRVISGALSQKERWKRGVEAVNDSLGEAVGRLYVERHFPPASKRAMEALVDNLKTAFATRLEANDWMSASTKAEARQKLAAFTTKIGYPDQWTDYDDFIVNPGDAFGNKRRAAQFEYDRMIAKLGQPVDTTEWAMTPQTVNAYYSPNRNEIVFPAAILQAPFFDPKADPAVNYGAIGAVIGHEIGHGFDDQGRKSDGTGMQRDWWAREDASRFGARAAALGKQFATYAPIEGMAVNPALTMGENIGDLGGLTMAYEAYRLSLGGQDAPVVDGLTGDQRFFLAWAQIWQRKYREEELKRRLVTDPHAPSAYRVNGIVRNMDAWYDAFGVAEDDALYLPPSERVRIW